MSAASELVQEFDPNFADNSLRYFELFAVLNESDKLSQELGTAILQLGKIRKYRSHPKGDMNILLRYQQKTKKSFETCINDLNANKSKLSTPTLGEI